MPAADRKPPAPALCVPAGDLAPWPAERYLCRCGAVLRMERTAPTINDWTPVTLGGERWRDDRPQGLRDDPAGWWDDLRRRMAAGDMRAAQTYSALTAREALGLWSWIHVHLPVDRVAAKVDRVEPPWCCRRPMWASPDGWVCRVSGVVFGYTA